MAERPPGVAPSAVVNSQYNEPPLICHIAHVLVGPS